MPVHRSSLLRPFAAAVMVAATSLCAIAQAPPTVRIRGTIESVDGSTLMIKSRDGTDMKVRVTDNVAVFGVAKKDDGTLEAARVNVGRDGITPPM